ncbi:hypothetical protein SCHPADRAFT_155405 [Schizopora paradoxa]|uniref:Uncharacterized protein n=1 Tax=Schizopora paradoxa TaxID=27342 RepID=A0A0H2S1E0_9AGAM|nr:hypothetical protein SCHPADRAFT_155405 [Schizopora paradoxa]
MILDMIGYLRGSLAIPEFSRSPTRLNSEKMRTGLCRWASLLEVIDSFTSGHPSMTIIFCVGAKIRF